MITLAIAVPGIVIYVAGFIITGRWWYARKRPFTEPLSCRWSFHQAPGEKHVSLCHMRPGSLVSSSGEALAIAALCGLGWPVFALGLAVLAVARLLLTDPRPLPDEVEAKTARLEREMGIGAERRDRRA